MAGMNAHLAVNEGEPLILKRSDAYIGVLIDDLISKGTQEPYRMFTSRAEFRTLLRQDNADIRLTELSNRLGLASPERAEKVKEKKDNVLSVIDKANSLSLTPELINEWLTKEGSSSITQKQKLSQLILRPGIALKHLAADVPQVGTALAGYDDHTIEQAEIQMKYQVYIDKEKELVGRMNQMEELEIPNTFDYMKVQAISHEAREKLFKMRPRTLGQASRISGINPSDVQILMVYMGR